MAFRLGMNVVLAGMFAIAGVVPMLTHQADAVLPWEKPTFDYAANVPTWQPQYAKRFAGCGPEKVLGDLVVVTQDAEVQHMDFDTAWKRTHNDEWADDVWVVGWCK